MRADVGAAARSAIFSVLTEIMNFLVWQLIDSGFPAGGFAHSGGLEASVQHRHVRDAEGVRAFARQTLVQTGHSALPLVRAAHRDPRISRISIAFLTCFCRIRSPTGRAGHKDAHSWRASANRFRVASWR